MPPPSVRPPTPVVEMIPPGAARPKRQVDDQAAIDGAEAGHAVAPATNRQVEAGVAGSTDHGHHVGRIYALDDRAGSAVVHDVVDGAGLVVVGIRGGDDATAHRFGQCLDRVAHGVILRFRFTIHARRMRARALPKRSLSTGLAQKPGGCPERWEIMARRNGLEEVPGAYSSPLD